MEGYNRSLGPVVMRYLPNPALAQPRCHKCFTLQAEGLEPEFCAIEDNEAVRLVQSETWILLVPVKVT